ncbi:amino acid transporter [Ilyonectria robusta]
MLIYRRRDPKYLPKDRPFKVPNAIGWACNIISVAYALIAVVFFQFPWSTTVDLSTTMSKLQSTSVFGYMIPNLM